MEPCRHPVVPKNVIYVDLERVLVHVDHLFGDSIGVCSGCRYTFKFRMGEGKHLGNHTLHYSRWVKLAG